MTSLLAVYGTLRRGYRNHALIEPGSAPVGDGFLPGRLLHIASPLRRYAYPGYLADGSGRVVVEVVDILDEALWPSLDALERCRPEDPDGSEYVRRTAVAHVGGQPLTCWTYVYNAEVDGYGQVPGGDWSRMAAPIVTGP